jgi:hypothetical protein
MATGSRTLKLSILADVDQLNKSLKAANGDVEDSSNRISDFGKKAGLAFAAAAVAAGAYAIKIGIDGVKAAIEDDAAQQKLARTLEAVTGATVEQIQSVEDQITKMSLATGVADDKLRPALSRLALSTGDITKAQDLLSIALDVSTATGKPLEAVSNAISKAYDGNAASLGKLGLGLSAAELKSMSFTEVTTKLSDLFGGAAAANAETYEGKIARLKIGLDEAKETIGFALLPIVTKLIDYINREVVPAFGAFAEGLNGKEGITEGFTNTQLVAYTFGTSVRSLGKSFEGLFSVFNNEANTGQSSGLATLVGWLDTIIKALDKVVKFASFTFGLLGAITDPKKWGMNATELSASLVTAPSTGTTGIGAGGGYVGSVFVAPTIKTPTIVVPSMGDTGGGGGSVPSSVGSSAGAAAKATSNILQNIQVAGVSGYAQALAAMGAGAAGAGGQGFGTNSGGVNVYMGVVGDPEAAARVIVDTVNNSSYRGTGGANNFVLVK